MDVLLFFALNVSLSRSRTAWKAGMTYSSLLAVAVPVITSKLMNRRTSIAFPFALPNMGSILILFQARMRVDECLGKTYHVGSGVNGDVWLKDSVNNSHYFNPP